MATVQRGNVPKNPTWEELIAKYRAAKLGDLRESTVKVHTYILGRIGRYFTDCGILPSAMTVEDYELYLAERADSGVSRRTREHESITLRSMLNLMVERKHLRRNVLEKFKPPRADEAYVRVPSAGELAKIIDEARDRANPARHKDLKWRTQKDLKYHSLRNIAVITVLIDSGARIGEVLNLKMEHLDPLRRQLALVDTKTHTSRVVPISEPCVTAINEYLRVRPSGKSEHIFLTEYGGKLDRNSFSQVFRRIVQGAGLNNVTLHSIRHYSITEMARVDVYAAMQKAGHRDLNTTQGYLKRDSEHVRQVSEVAGVLSKVTAEQKTRRKRLK